MAQARPPCSACPSLRLSSPLRLEPAATFRGEGGEADLPGRERQGRCGYLAGLPREPLHWEQAAALRPTSSKPLTAIVMGDSADPASRHQPDLSPPHVMPNAHRDAAPWCKGNRVLMHESRQQRALVPQNTASSEPCSSAGAVSPRATACGEAALDYCADSKHEPTARVVAADDVCGSKQPEAATDGSSLRSDKAAKSQSNGGAEVYKTRAIGKSETANCNLKMRNNCHLPELASISSQRKPN
ncbi:uncharacterized protein LOC125460537 [Stegostoma tigrinum]|uniref:uncharacterized protein LOC125460537 n=1 Tax=Stegostoma tigrinum TaxID=3053191 RepID=UPI00202B695F|nr:uncharacterized protein LOC125460537 [Stegostoma tigrinum]